MKFIATVFIAILILIMPTISTAQKSCCSATESFAAFGSSEPFQGAHQLPATYLHKDGHGTMQSIDVANDASTNVYNIVAPGSNLYVIVIHEWWGLNDNIKAESDRIFQALGENVNVIAIDLYNGVVATTRQDASNAMQGLKKERARAIIGAVLEFCGPNARIGTIGWCLGGGWSLQASLMAHSNAAACVMYYGMPESDVDVLKTLNAPVLGIFATEDAWITPQIMRDFERDMGAAEKMLSLKIYKADHAFANPSNSKHDVQATKSAFEASMEFFTTHLKN